jgi:hypothetical protein
VVSCTQHERVGSSNQFKTIIIIHTDFCIKQLQNILLDENFFSLEIKTYRCSNTRQVTVTNVEVWVWLKQVMRCDVRHGAWCKQFLAFQGFRSPEITFNITLYTQNHISYIKCMTDEGIQRIIATTRQNSTEINWNCNQSSLIKFLS